jgi:hypothetical protein
VQWGWISCTETISAAASSVLFELGERTHAPYRTGPTGSHLARAPLRQLNVEDCDKKHGMIDPRRSLAARDDQSATPRRASHERQPCLLRRLRRSRAPPLLRWTVGSSQQGSRPTTKRDSSNNVRWRCLAACFFCGCAAERSGAHPYVSAWLAQKTYTMQPGGRAGLCFVFFDMTTTTRTAAQAHIKQEPAQATSDTRHAANSSDMHYYRSTRNAEAVTRPRWRSGLGGQDAAVKGRQWKVPEGQSLDQPAPAGLGGPPQLGMHAATMPSGRP